MKLLVWAVLVVLAAGLAGCGPGGKHHDAGAGTEAEQGLVVLRRFAQCARDHGYPAFPDPVLDNGEVSFPVDDQRAIKDQIQTIMNQLPECKAIMDSFQGSGHGGASPPSAADLAKLK